MVNVATWLNSLICSVVQGLPVGLRAFTIIERKETMPDYSMRGPKPKGNVDPDKFADDLVAALKETGKQMKGAVKRIKVVDDTVNFTVEPTAVAERIVEALKKKLGVDVHPATTPFDAFAEKYGIAKSE